MSKELCFHIENKDIYLEQVLVDYENIPIFFLCSDKKIYYVSLCTDIEELHYVIVKLSVLDVYNLLHGLVPMRDIILKQRYYWDIKAGDNIISDIVKKNDIKTLPVQVLPEENACYKILTNTVQMFVNRFDCEFLSTKNFTLSDSEVELSECSENFSLDALINNINRFISLAECKLEKNDKNGEKIYDKKMQFISKSEITTKTYKITKSKKLDNSFELGKQIGDNRVIAA